MSLKVKKITFHPILSGRENICIPVKVELTFCEKYRFFYQYDNLDPRSISIDCDFEFDPKDSYEIKGRLWAFDRQTENCYFTLHPIQTPKSDNPYLNVVISIGGDPIFCILNVVNS